jgi:hypothetical protein
MNNHSRILSVLLAGRYKLKRRHLTELSQLPLIEGAAKIIFKSERDLFFIQDFTRYFMGHLTTDTLTRITEKVCIMEMKGKKKTWAPWKIYRAAPWMMRRELAQRVLLPVAVEYDQYRLLHDIVFPCLDNDIIKCGVRLCTIHGKYDQLEIILSLVQYYPTHEKLYLFIVFVYWSVAMGRVSHITRYRQFLFRYKREDRIKLLDRLGVRRSIAEERDPFGLVPDGNYEILADENFDL